MAIDNITPKNTIKGWFKRGIKPMEAQFHAWMDSYWHKSEPIPTATIEGLETILNSKAETADITSIRTGMEEHANDVTRHKTAADQSKLNNLADNADATYARKSELEAIGAIIIPVDFTNPELDIEGYITTFIQPFFEDGSFFEKPVYANFIWKTDYTEGATNVDRSVLIPSTVYQSIRTFGYEFKQPVDILYSYNNKIGKYELMVEYLNTKPTVPRVYFTEYIYDSDMTIFVEENGDGIIAAQDGPKWREFYNALLKGLNPAIYLKTDNTDVYIPASYKFVKDPEKNVYVGDIQISYLKNVNGRNQLWTETRKFTPSSGGFVGSVSLYEVPAEGIVQKIPLGGASKPYIIRCTFDNLSTGTGTANTEDIAAYYNAVNEGMDPTNVVISYSGGLWKTTNNVVMPNNGILMTAPLVIAQKKDADSTSFGHGYDSDIVAVTSLILSASISNDVWTSTVHRDMVDVKTYDYLKVSNIQVVAEYPTDLNSYPDGSIFIKQQTS